MIVLYTMEALLLGRKKPSLLKTKAVVRRNILSPGGDVCWVTVPAQGTEPRGE